MKFYIHKLGCPKNDVDADYISARLMADGHQPVFDPEQAESIIVNTCGFILPAKEESIFELLRLGQLKKSAGVKTLFATGCLSQRNGEELLQGMPELDGAFGLGQLDAIADAVKKGTVSSKPVVVDSRRLAYLDFGERFIDADSPYAYLKISDGCDNLCAYCAIPRIRGQYRSRPMESILAEARYLAEHGKRELILVSQDSTLYGHDYPASAKVDIVSLLKELESIEGVKWIRLMYLHPAHVADGLVEYLVSGSKTLPYFDLPLQHINSEILKSMNRKIDRDGIIGLLDKIRRASSEATIRTTFIVGYPGETIEQFGELQSFVSDFEFDRLGVFGYSPEDDTPAADLPGQISEEEKFRRLDELMMLQQEIAFAKNNSLIGSQRDVIIDAICDDGGAIGRTCADCPEIDQEVYVTGGNPGIGDICRVTITASQGYDLEGHFSRE
ncbi:MAG: 30S ribosomal protein S12 methylthiotransferase RimO [Candidatus Zixiibacteriota bacterium]